MKQTMLICLGAALLPLAAQAIEPGPSSPQQQVTETWLQLQSSNQMASPNLQTVTPAERELSLQRLLDSYKHPIPPFYKEYGLSSSKGN